MAAAGVLSARNHGALREELAFLPARTAGDFAARIARAADRGVVVGEFAGEQLVAFLGAFTIDDFRGLGAGAYGPDWCHGYAEALDGPSAMRRLYRELARRLVEKEIRIHAFGFYATEQEILEAMYATGFGQIVIDAAVATSDLARSLQEASTAIFVRRAAPDDAPLLERLNEELARHIADLPVFFPDPRGMIQADWRTWLLEESHVALIASEGGDAIGYIKAQEPQLDVTFAVHDETTLAINGMYVDPSKRRGRVGARLLLDLANTAAAGGKRMISVDFESTNIEAEGFWLRWFHPVTRSVERRL